MIIYLIIWQLAKFRIPQAESIIFVRLHNFPFAGTFIVNAAKMKNAVDNYAQKFVIVGRTDSDGIGSDSVERDEYIAANETPGSIVKSDNIGEVVMIEKLLIDLENASIVTKNICESTGAPLMTASHLNNPPLHLNPVERRNINILRQYFYHRVSKPNHKYKQTPR